MMRTLKQFWVEILALFLFVLGILFLTDRGRLVEGISNLTGRIFRNIAVAFSIFATFFKNVLSHPSNILGLILIVAAFVLINIRVRESFFKSPIYSGRECPVCDEKLQRSDQKMLDFLVGLFTPLKRYECSNYKCGWTGRRATARRG
ncbi:hypothetical protein ACFL4G_04010 [Thermodesulfobacteriota bacterium]